MDLTCHPVLFEIEVSLKDINHNFKDEDGFATIKIVEDPFIDYYDDYSNCLRSTGYVIKGDYKENLSLYWKIIKEGELLEDCRVNWDKPDRVEII